MGHLDAHGASRIIEYEVANCTKEVAKVTIDEGPIVILFHDESAFQAHDTQEKSWVLDSQYQLRKKRVGRGIHRSDFIGPTGGWCRGTDQIREEPRRILSRRKEGQGDEGWLYYKMPLPLQFSRDNLLNSLEQNLEGTGRCSNCT